MFLAREKDLYVTGFGKDERISTASHRKNGSSTPGKDGSISLFIFIIFQNYNSKPLQTETSAGNTQLIYLDQPFLNSYRAS